MRHLFQVLMKHGGVAQVPEPPKNFWLVGAPAQREPAVEERVGEPEEDPPPTA